MNFGLNNIVITTENVVERDSTNEEAISLNCLFCLIVIFILTQPVTHSVIVFFIRLLFAKHWLNENYLKLQTLVIALPHTYWYINNEKFGEKKPKNK